MAAHAENNDGRPKIALVSAMAAVGVAVLLSLGYWQLERREWKEDLLATMAARRHATALEGGEVSKLRCSLVDDVGLAQSCDYQRVRLRGMFDHANERHIFAGAQPASNSPEFGYWIFTPFTAFASEKESAPKTILVNCGFVPASLKNPASRVAGQIEGETEIVAQVRSRQTRSWFDGSNDVARNVYYVRDPRELGFNYGKQTRGQPLLGPRWFYLEVVEDKPPGGWPKPLAAQLILTNRHLEYALTWFGLAFTLVAVYAAFIVSRLRRQ